MLDFVRRRRWVRTRVRSEPGAGGPRAGGALHVAMADMSGKRGAARGSIRLSELLAQQSEEFPVGIAPCISCSWALSSALWHNILMVLDDC